MASTPELVRCPICGSKKIKRPGISGTATDVLCFCRGTGIVMESLIDRVTNLATPKETEDIGSPEHLSSEPITIVPQDDTFQADKINAPPGRHWIKSLFAVVCRKSKHRSAHHDE